MLKIWMTMQESFLKKKRRVFYSLTKTQKLNNRKMKKQKRKRRINRNLRQFLWLMMKMVMLTMVMLRMEMEMEKSFRKRLKRCQKTQRKPIQMMNNFASVIFNSKLMSVKHHQHPPPKTVINKSLSNRSYLLQRRVAKSWKTLHHHHLTI